MCVFRLRIDYWVSKLNLKKGKKNWKSCVLVRGSNVEKYKGGKVAIFSCGLLRSLDVVE